MTTVPNRSTFENAYAGQAPWDIGKPQQVFVDVADRVTGSVLDAGCGTGDNALYFAVIQELVPAYPYTDFLTFVYEDSIRRACHG